MYSGIIKLQQWPIGFYCKDKGYPAEVLPMLSKLMRLFDELENDLQLEGEAGEFEWQIVVMTHLGQNLPGRFIINHEIETAKADYTYVIHQQGIDIIKGDEHILSVPKGLECLVEPIPCEIGEESVL